MTQKPLSPAELMARIENQARPIKAWSYVVTINNRRHLSCETWATRRAVIAYLEELCNAPWPFIKAAGYEVVKVTTYEGWAG